MADEEVKLGSDEPKAAAAPDMDRYYYPPGATEPVLKPEFANAAAAAVPEAESSEPDEGKAKRGGSLPNDFPHVELLRAAGVTSYSKVRALNGDYSSIDGIAEARGADIDAALAE